MLKYHSVTILCTPIPAKVPKMYLMHFSATPKQSFEIEI
jgi:hypothetical protein